MKFIIEEKTSTKKAHLIYIEEDFSFDIEPHEGTGFTSIMVNDLQLEIDDVGKIIYVWGLCPLIMHEKTKEFPKNYTSNSLVALLDNNFTPGVSYRLNESERWPIYINKKEGWICIGNPQIKGKQMIEFALNCVAVLENQKITAIWLKPKKFPKSTII